jgi:hypothetical protein
VTAPEHRLDIGTGVTGAADLIEEVARIHGFDRIPVTEMADTLPPQREVPAVDLEERVRDLLVVAGLQEVITYRLTTPEREAALTPAVALSGDRPYVQVANPISADRVVMRRTLLPGLLRSWPTTRACAIDSGSSRSVRSTFRGGPAPCRRSRGESPLRWPGGLYRPRGGSRSPAEPTFSTSRAWWELS